MIIFPLNRFFTLAILARPRLLIILTDNETLRDPCKLL